MRNCDYAQVISEYDSANTVAVEYIFGDDLLAQNRSGTLSNYHYDGLGSTRALSDSTGNVSDEYFYDAFGVELARTGTTENDYLFTGEQYDAGLGNYYLRARYYDQGVGRFTQQDTWMGINSDPVTLHKYLYANADPVTYTDPTGNFSIMTQVQAQQVVGILITLAVSNIIMNTSNNSHFVLAALPGGEKLDNLIKRKNKDDEEPTETLYHGTSARRAYSIAAVGFMPSFDTTIYFSDNREAALEWAQNIKYRRPKGETPPTRFGVVEFDIPKSLMNSLGLNIKYPVGTCRGVSRYEQDSGSNTERCMIGNGRRLIFNGALLKNVIKANVKKY